MSSCPNCGKSGYDKSSKHPECESCGYKIVPATVLPEANLIFCEDCACFYFDACTKGHPFAVQKHAEFHKPTVKK